MNNLLNKKDSNLIIKAKLYSAPRKMLSIPVTVIENKLKNLIVNVQVGKVSSLKK